MKRILAMLGFWAALLSAVLAIVSTLLIPACGKGFPRRFFTSWPMAIFWCLVAVLLAASILRPRAWLRQPAAALLHLGALLVVLGAMYNSEKAHELRRDHFDTDKAAVEQFILPSGDHVRVGDRILQLRRAWTEYYPADVDHWEFFVFLPDERGHAKSYEQLDLFAGPAVSELTGAGIELLEYVSDDDVDEPTIVIVAGRETFRMPASVGETLRVEDPPVSFRVDRVYDPVKKPLVSPTEIMNHAVARHAFARLDIEAFGQTRTESAVPPEYLRLGGGLPLIFLPNHRHYNRPAPPAVLLRLSRNEHESELWYAPGNDYLPLSMLYEDARAWIEAGSPRLAMMPPVQMPSDYKADLVAYKDGGDFQPVASKVIEVNDPLHTGGYYVYLNRVGEDGRAVQLLAHSDDGLWVVFAGFVLVMIGALALWLPPFRPLRRREAA